MSKPLMHKLKPFVKWAGGKRQLLPDIRARLPRDMPATYVEPFIGGGAVLIDRLSDENFQARTIINDMNADLVGCYKSIKSASEPLIEKLSELQTGYDKAAQTETGKSAFYYDIREAFNRRDSDELTQAAFLICLNRTGFNGLYRVNKSGGYNVPIGRYKNPKICDADNIRNLSVAMQTTEILNVDFETTLDGLDAPAFFYFDPPYKPLSSSSSFNAYAKSGFNDEAQVRLAKFCRKLDGLGHKWLLSNSDVKTGDNPSEFFDDLYKGFNIKRVLAGRAINSNKDKRGAIKELLISNY